MNQTKHMRSSLIFTAVLLLCVTLCSADGVIGDPQVTLTFLTANPPGNIYGGYYAYPYSVLVGTGPGASAVPMMCDDFTDDIGSGDSWLSTAYALTQTNLANGVVSDLKYANNASFGGGVYDPTSAVTAYEEAAYLLTQLALGTPGFTPEETNAAVWYLFSPTSSTGDATAKGLLDTAYTFVTNNTDLTYYSNVTVFTQGPMQSGAESQEFLEYTPEPPASLLLVIGFALIGAVGLKRRKQVAAQVIEPRSDC